MQTHIKTTSYSCNNYLFLFLNQIYSNSKPKHRQRKFKPTSEAQKAVNEKIKGHKLEMLIAYNFNESAMFATYTYTEENNPHSDEEAEKNAKNYIRRIRHSCEQKNLEPPLIIWTTEKAGKYHHHFLIQCGLDNVELEKLWQGKNGKPLGIQTKSSLIIYDNSLEKLADYIKKTKTHIGKRRYHCTKNIEQPPPQITEHTTQKQFCELCDCNITNETIAKYYPGYCLCCGFHGQEVTTVEMTGEKHLFLRLQKIKKEPADNICKLEKKRKRRTPKGSTVK